MTHYLLTGGDVQLKEERILSLKEALLPAPDARTLDCDVLYARKLSIQDLKKALISLPAVADRRVVVLRNAEHLPEAHKDLVRDFLASDQASAVLVIEAQWTAADKYVKAIRPFVTVQECFLPEKENVFAVTRLLERGQPADAAAALNRLLDDGAHPLQLMGGLVWFWGKTGRRMTGEDAFKKGLLCLQEADMNIKRSKLSPECALEVLLAKLALLLKG